MGGGTNNDGNIFSIDTNGNGYRDLFDFSGSNGANPNGSLIILRNKLFGMAGNGGANSHGNIFSIDTNGNAFKDLLDFSGSSGSHPGGAPEGSLNFYGNILYGMASGGGANDGNIFSLDTNGNNYKDLFDFSSSNGQSPYGDLTISANILYGTTSGGGSNKWGTVFSFKDTNVITSINGVPTSYEINLFPNPVNKVVIINSPISITKIDIDNMLGQNVYSNMYNTKKVMINISTLTTGVYFIRINDTYVKKIVKE